MSNPKSYFIKLLKQFQYDHPGEPFSLEYDPFLQIGERQKYLFTTFPRKRGGEMLLPCEYMRKELEEFLKLWPNKLVRRLKHVRESRESYRTVKSLFPLNIGGMIEMFPPLVTVSSCSYEVGFFSSEVRGISLPAGLGFRIMGVSKSVGSARDMEEYSKKKAKETILGLISDGSDIFLSPFLVDNSGNMHKISVHFDRKRIFSAKRRGKFRPRKEFRWRTAIRKL